jgi:hypothetical protein
MMMILLRIRFEGTLKSHHRAIQWTNYGLIFGPAGFKSGSAILFANGDHGHSFGDLAITVTVLVAITSLSMVTTVTQRS